MCVFVVSVFMGVLPLPANVFHHCPCVFGWRVFCDGVHSCLTLARLCVFGCSGVAGGVNKSCRASPPDLSEPEKEPANLKVRKQEEGGKGKKMRKKESRGKGVFGWCEGLRGWGA